ncbi:rod shape-determining protein MreC [filamentous cyanobacterium LEGE 11480]|uniref:Cell shape-determining protein MreC n=1 Tax=Romeriopsis navalis LEGE 11480 TaxID=2777977 RepID=A0A928VQF1_9CYAN|nr:rod shape-determining protein MreC [Romeriopsis navalis]MBE9030700.1 rod shape-determining protein MreC [Romeriopsis navalis LEGE 11480]
MVTVRRWWERYGVITGLIALAIVSGVVVRQTQAAPLSEIWVWLSRPFIKADQANSVQPETVPQQPALASAKFLEIQQRLVELEAENERLQQLAGLKTKTKGQGITAPVVGRSGDHWWQQATLGLGSKNGIKPNQIVMAPGGVVGFIESVTPNTSRVLLISDTNSKTGVVVSRSRATGYMKGIGDNRAVMEFFQKVPDVRVGDAVAISNLSKKYPKGLPVGRIESIELDKSPAPEARIELSAPISSLEWVIIYPSPPVLDPAPEAKPTNTPAPNIDPAFSVPEATPSNSSN